jgi:multidrug resistance efflux pump
LTLTKALETETRKVEQFQLDAASADTLRRDKAELEARNAKLTQDMERLQEKLTLSKSTKLKPTPPVDDLEARNKLLARLDSENTELRGECVRLLDLFEKERVRVKTSLA